MATSRKQVVLSLIAVVGAGAVVVAAAALPWISFGQRTYSAFAAARATRSLRLFESLNVPAARWAVIALLSTPVVVPLASVLLTLGFRKVGAVLLFVVGLFGALAGGLVVASSEGTIGPIVALTGGIAACFAAIALGFTRKSSGLGSPVR
jgi:hypothetical protein